MRLERFTLRSTVIPSRSFSNNMFYDPKVLGPYCEALDPQLAFIAYKKGAGECDDELIAICHTTVSTVTLLNTLWNDRTWSFGRRF